MTLNFYKCLLFISIIISRFSFSQDIEYYWSGAISENSATIVFATSSEANVKIQYSENSRFRKRTEFSNTVSTDPELDYFSKIVLDDLNPSTAYYYRFSVNGIIKKDKDVIGRFKTPSNEPFSFKVTLATCATTGSNNPVFDRIREEESLFYLMLGDIHYGNIYRDCEQNFLSYYRSVLGSKKQSKLYQNTPIAYMWDDHDYGPNNSSGLSPNQNGYIACQSEARHAYQSYVPHYPLSFGQGDTLISQSFNIGRLKFILTDLRSEKRRPLFTGDCEMPDATDCEKIMPGSNFGYPDHLQWFKNELLDAKSNNLAVIWHSSFPFISTPDLSWFNCDDENTIRTEKGYECDDHDNWGWYPEERENIANFIKENDIPICIVSGDAHMSAIDDGTNSDYATDGGAPIPVFHAGPLDRRPSVKGGPYSHGRSGIRGQYGVMDIIDDGGDEICINWKVKNYEGELVYNETGEILQHSFCLQVNN